MAEFGTAELSLPMIFPGRGEFRHGLGEVDDEYQNRDIFILKPVESVVVEKEVVSGGEKKIEKIDLDEGLREEMAYLSRTRDLEINTPRVSFLQDLADRMTEGTGKKVRVVVMNKGGEAEAFVMPEGTVFINQACLNALESLDEIGGVLAHEVRHHLQETYKKELLTKGFLSKFGVGWLHEAASDVLTSQLLEKAGLNSLGFSSAIVKIAAAERGTVHQSGLMRGSLTVAEHRMMDHRTSEQKETAMVAEWLRPAKETNLEMAQKAIKRKEIKKFRQILDHLHPRDLKEVIETLLWQIGYDEKADHLINPLRKMLEGCFELISERLAKKGYSQEERALFWLGITELKKKMIFEASSYWRFLSEKVIRTPEELVVLTRAAEKFDDEKKFSQMHEEIFSSKRTGRATADLIAHLEKVYDYTETVKGCGVPITREALMESLEILSSREGGVNPTEVLLRYLSEVFLSRVKEGELDEDQIRDFWEEVKERGIAVDVNYLKNSFYWRPIFGSGENAGKVRKTFLEIFEIAEQKEEIDPEKLINEMLELAPDWIDKDLDFRRRGLEQELRRLVKFFYQEGLTDKQRLVYLGKIKEAIEKQRFLSRVDWLNYLATGEGELRYCGATVEETPEAILLLNEKIIKFNLQLFCALALFKKDGPEFYGFVAGAMADLQTETASFSKRQLLGLLRNLWRAGEYQNSEFFSPREVRRTGFLWTLGIKNYGSFCELPLVKEVLGREEPIKARNMAELYRVAEDFLFLMPEKEDIFSDSLAALVIAEEVRKSFLKLTEAGFLEKDYPDLLRFVEAYYPEGVLKDEVIRKIHRQYLQSSEIGLEDKTNYLLENYDSIGLEGTEMVAEEITVLADFRIFRERLGRRWEEYLKGSGLVTKVALGDFLSSFLAGRKSFFLQSTSSSEEAKKRDSTNLVRNWFEYFVGTGRDWDRVRYSTEFKKFLVRKEGRNYFRSIAEMMATLKNLSMPQRFLLMMKVLVEKDGALTSDDERKQLAKELVGALGFGQGFVRETIVTACEIADAKYISGPLASMMGPKLFSSLDAEAIDYEEIAKTEVAHYEVESDEESYSRKPLSELISLEEQRRMGKATTRELVFYGFQFVNCPDSALGRLAQETYQQNLATDEGLRQLLKIEETAAGDKRKEEEIVKIDPAVEAVIRAVEASGTLGVRSLQLARQLYRFSEGVDRRLADCLDANRGLNKFFFWMNLLKLAEDSQEVRQFVEKRLASLESYLGGGSLFTTYRATVLNDQGEEEEAVLKMLNPNSLAFVEKTHEISQQTLKRVERRGGESRRFARMGKVLIDLGREWCLKDINDQTFSEDDRDFRGTIAGFNQSLGKEVFFAPKVLFDARKLKSEGRAAGRTLNAILNDEAVDPAYKKELVELVSRFFVYQLSQPLSSGRYLVHSDPHVGNFVVDEEGGLKIGVIDRGLYLRLTAEDVRVARALAEGKRGEFMELLVERVLEVNGVKSRARREEVKLSIKMEVAKEYARNYRKKSDNFSLLNVVMNGLIQRKLQIPLELRLMIKNIGSIQELVERNGVFWGKIAQFEEAVEGIVDKGSF